MLLAIDVGNTHTVFALKASDDWLAIWRRPTHVDTTEDGLAVWLRALFDMTCLEWQVSQAVCASVVPSLNGILDRFCEQWLQVRLRFLTDGAAVGLPVDYDGHVGADRLANALGALDEHEPPFIVVDCGTATTFDVVDQNGKFIGGSIMPGLALQAEYLTKRTSRLPPVELVVPDRALGKSTVTAIQSGLMFGYAGAVDAIVNRIRCEIDAKDAKVIATGGLGSLLLGLSSTIELYEPTLTIDGLAVAAKRLAVH